MNTILAEGWRHSTGEEFDDAALAAGAEAFSLQNLPPEILIMTAGVDVQKDRLEVLFVGFSRDESFVLGQSVIWGSPEGDDVWAELDDALGTIWTHPLGGILRLDATAIDAGDGTTMDRVLSYCRPRWSRRIFATKGAPGNRQAIKASGQKGNKLFIVGVDGVKQSIFNRLSAGKSIRFSHSLEPRFFEELASERLELRYIKGAPVRTWKRIPGRRAESLDCLVYATAVRNLVGVNLDRREDELASRSLPPPRPTTIRSKWLESR